MQYSQAEADQSVELNNGDFVAKYWGDEFGRLVGKITAVGPEVVSIGYSNGDAEDEDQDGVSILLAQYEFSFVPLSNALMMRPSWMIDYASKLCTN